jgi:SSS family solute:Na+ symporter
MTGASPAAVAPPLDGVALGVFGVIFGAVSILGFLASRWRRGDLRALDEWGLGGRRFGTVVSWFLIGGDLYTAYTLIAVPAAIATAGASGFFAVPYTILAYPIMFAIMPRLWNVSKRHGFVTPADFVRGRYGDATLAFVVALTGILATMPYIALQLVGVQVLLARMGIGGTGLAADIPLAVAFAILAAFTYTSGLRAPAAIAFVKDAMIYLVIIVAIVVIPARVGGFGAMFAAASAHFAAVAAATGKPSGSVTLGAGAYWSYATLALGSALALFIYPHAVTGVLSASRVQAVRRNAVLLPAYSLLLALFALLGYAAVAAHVSVAESSQTVPALFAAMFPSWFTGFAFAAIGIGALVPAGVMSIAAANLWTRNIYKAYLRPQADDAEQTRNAKLASLVVKLGALAFIVFVPAQQAINFQLLGGIWILQTFPAIVGGLWRRYFHNSALAVGWAVGMLFGTIEAFSQGVKGVKPTMAISLGGATLAPYIGLVALLANLAVAYGLTMYFDRSGVARGVDETHDDDYVGEAVARATTTLGTR